jgi:hypothetical protein
MRIQDIINESRYIKFHPKLNSKLWEGTAMRPEVRAKLLEIARAFYKFVGVDLNITDITVTGSNSAYTYTNHSDLDLHLIVEGSPSDEERELYDAKKGLWNEQHDIFIRDLPVEVYIQGSDDEHHSSGVFSVLREEWLTRPNNDEPTIDDVSVAQKVRYLTREIKGAINDSDRTKADATKTRLAKMRKEGLAETGEWGAENIAYKTLRNKGLIDALNDHIRHLLDQELSLEQQRT